MLKVWKNASERKSAEKQKENDQPAETMPTDETPLESKKREAIVFCKERFMSEKGSENVNVMPGVTLTNLGTQGEMYSSRSGGIFMPSHGNQMSRAAFMHQFGSTTNVQSRAEEYMKGHQTSAGKLDENVDSINDKTIQVGFNRNTGLNVQSTQFLDTDLAFADGARTKMGIKDQTQ